jgi:hypothetical protein
MKIKDEYKGQTIVKNTTLGNMRLVVDNIDVSRYRHYVSIGFGYLFEEENISTTAPEQCIRYEGIESDEQTEAPIVTKTKTKRKRANGKTTQL